MASGTLGIWLMTLSIDVLSLGGLGGTCGTTLGGDLDETGDEAFLEAGEAALLVTGAAFTAGVLGSGANEARDGVVGSTWDLALSSLMISLIFSNVS